MQMTIQLHILPDLQGTADLLEQFPKILQEPFNIEYVAKLGDATVRFKELDQYIELMLALIRVRNEQEKDLVPTP